MAGPARGQKFALRGARCARPAAPVGRADLLRARGVPLAADEATADLYRGLASAEVRHRDLFLDLAATVDADGWRPRLATLAAAESAIVARLPVRPRIH